MTVFFVIDVWFASFSFFLQAKFGSFTCNVCNERVAVGISNENELCKRKDELRYLFAVAGNGLANWGQLSKVQVEPANQIYRSFHQTRDLR